jgi:hypothetical protein
MINDYTVLIRYKNKKLEDIGQSIYPLTTYTEMLSTELKSCLGDIEEAFHTMLGEDCDLRNNEAFMRIRKQILDASNSIGRLPDTMQCKGSSIKAISSGDYIASLVDGM